MAVEAAQDTFNTWFQQLLALNGPGVGVGGCQVGERFGATIARDGDTVVVGTPNFSSYSGPHGRALVFVRSGHQWSLQATLAPTAPFQSASFGQAIAISGDTIVVDLHVFVRSGTTWTTGNRIPWGTDTQP